MDIKARVRALNDQELTRFVNAFDSPLSGSGIGEGEAFQLMAELEGIAIAEYRARGLSSTGSSNPLGGLPDEQQAGYIA